MTDIWYCWRPTIDREVVDLHGIHPLRTVNASQTPPSAYLAASPIEAWELLTLDPRNSSIAGWDLWQAELTGLVRDMLTSRIVRVFIRIPPPKIEYVATRHQTPKRRLN